MKIIDAHLHLFPENEPQFEEMAQSVGHHNSAAHLRQAYRDLGIVHGVVMGNRSALFRQGASTTAHLAERIEENLASPACCGVKLYPGYNKTWLWDPLYEPVYTLAARYRKPVAIHMGLTASASAHLKYCHPLTLDEVAADHPDTQFVMCHFGNPFLESAAAVVEKNPNVAADLSGLLEGRVDLSRYQQEQTGWLSLLRTWLTAMDRWEDLLFGTDWPIVNLAEYVDFIRLLVPEARWEQVFFHNANRVYQLGL